MNKLLLASGSSRRKDYLEQMGLEYQSQGMDIDESVREGEAADVYVERLAREKALAGLASYADHVVLAADTTVVLNGNILGKPDDADHAKHMLKQLSGSQHYVMTGIALAKNSVDGQALQSQVVTTLIQFSELTDAQIENYVASGEPMDKAGAYGIQGKAGMFVEHIEGSYSNVVGLPLAQTAALLRTFGIPVL